MLLGVGYVDLSGITLPFSVSDIIGGTMQLLAVFGPFLAIGLAFILIPKFWGAVRNSLGGKGRH